MSRPAPKSAWKPGQSGNPGGRPKEYRKVVELARKRTPLAIKVLTEIAQSGENESARVAAANALLDRGWGKAAQVVDLNVSDRRADELSTAELMRIAAEGMGEKEVEH